MGLKRWKRHSEVVTRSRRWAALRQQALRRDDWKCRQCGARGRLEVHHVKPVRTHPELAFELVNLRSLCPSCHTNETRVELGGEPLSPARIAWRAAVRAIERDGKTTSSTKGLQDAR